MAGFRGTPETGFEAITDPEAKKPPGLREQCEQLVKLDHDGLGGSDPVPPHREQASCTAEDVLGLYARIDDLESFAQGLEMAADKLRAELEAAQAASVEWEDAARYGLEQIQSVFRAMSDLKSKLTDLL